MERWRKRENTCVSLGTLGTTISGYLGTWPMDPSEPSSYPVPNSLLPTPFSAFCTSDATGVSTPLSVCVGLTNIVHIQKRKFPILSIMLPYPVWICRFRNQLFLSSLFDSSLISLKVAVLTSVSLVSSIFVTSWEFEYFTFSHTRRVWIFDGNFVFDTIWVSTLCKNLRTWINIALVSIEL